MHLFAAGTDSGKDDSELPERTTLNSGEEQNEPSFQVHGFIDSIFHYEDLVDQPEDWRATTTRGTLRFFASPIEQLDVKVGIVGRLIGGTEELGSDFYMPIPMQEALLPEVPDT